MRGEYIIRQKSFRDGRNMRLKALDRLIIRAALRKRKRLQKRVDLKSPSGYNE